MDCSNDQFSELYEPCGSGPIAHSKTDFELENTDNYLIIKSPRSKVPGLVVGFMIAIIGFVFFARYTMPELKLIIYVAGIPMLLLIVLIVYCFIGDYHKKGDWLVWN